VGTAITAIVVAATIVVGIVAVTIALVILQSALATAWGTSTFVFRVHASAIRTITLVHFATFYSFGTAITAIVFAAAIVVVIVAVTIALVNLVAAFSFTFRVVFRVETFTHFAIGLDDLCTTAVTAIKLTSFIIIFIVTVAIALVIGYAARWLVIWIQTLAHFAVSLLDIATAVTAIKLTSFNIIFIVTVAIALELG